MKQIPLTKDRFALVNDADFEFLSQWKWRALGTKSTRTFYAVRSLKRVKGLTRGYVYMHRELLRPKKGMWVDHVDGNGLNNQRKNIRIVSPSLNALNQFRLRKDNKSGFVGVYWSKQKRKWHALVSFKEGVKHLGFFEDIRTAAKTVNDFRVSLFKT